MTQEPYSMVRLDLTMRLGIPDTALMREQDYRASLAEDVLFANSRERQIASCDPVKHRRKSSSRDGA